MDKFDRQLLTFLQADASVSNAHMGASIGLSASQVSRRRARLETDGVINGYRAEVNPEAVGLSLNAFIKVRLHSHSKTTAENFRQRVKSIPAIQLACAITGDADYLLRVRVQDLTALAELINEQLLAHADVREVRSDVVLDMIKDDGTVSLATP